MQVEENESKIATFSKKLASLEASAGRASQRMRRLGQSSGEEEKVALLLKEVQTVKNQVYYLQQAILQMRAQVGRPPDTCAGAGIPAGAGGHPSGWR